MTITVYSGKTRMIAYESDVLPSVGHILDIDGTNWRVERTSSTITRSLRRSAPHCEGEFLVRVVIHGALS